MIFASILVFSVGDSLPLYTVLTLRTMVYTPVPLFNIPLSNQLGNIVLSDAIGALANFVGKSTEIARKERALGVSLVVYEESLSRSQVSEK